jgi:trk system potassium uptake protein TrkH
MALARKKRYGGQATRVVALSFGGIILVGTVLLLLPMASASGKSCGLMTALFTATSATCVTGLVLVDTLTSWTLFGQAVILLMIQLGGLGFMTVIYLMACMLRRKLSLHQRLLMVSAFNLNDMNDVGRVVVDALKLTFAMEGVGAVILALCFMPRYGLRGIWKGVFIAVSAYCNAGFDLLGPEGLGSISSYNGQPIVLFTVMALVVGGGLGFFVWKEIREKRSFRALSLYSKMVIWLTGSLVVFGWVFFLCAEWSNQATLGAMPIWKRVLNALFQSVTLRTAGFAAIDQGGLTEVSQVLSILLMLVGGSSGSTAGGLKTVTVGVLLLALKSCLRGREEVTFRERTIPQRKVLASLTLVLVVGAVFIVSSMAIAVVDGATYLSAAFEAASAIATVGLTTGITSGLSPLSHLMLICMMYLGRVGILSFSLAFLTQSGGANKIGYPETSVMIG